MHRQQLQLLGALIGVGVILLVLLAFGGGTYRVTAAFADVDGLVSGAQVRAGGVVVGSVDNIWLAGDGYPRVSMDVDDDYLLHSTATANLREWSVGGEANRFIELTNGSGPRLAAGATIPMSRTAEPVELDAVTSILSPRTRADLAQIFRGLNRSVAGRGGQIAAILRDAPAGMGNTADLMGQLDGDGTALRSLVSDSAAVVATLAQNPGSLSGTADELAQMLGTLASRQQALGAGIAQLPAGLRAAQAALGHLRASVGTLRGLVRAATPGTARLPGFATRLEPVMNSAVPALHDLRALIVDGPAQLRAIDALLRTVRAVSPPLTATLTSLTPIVNQLRARFPDVFAFLANWADFTDDYDAVGHGGRVGLVQSPTPTNAIGPADDKGGELAPPFIRDPGVLGGAPWTNYQQSFVGAQK